MLAIIYQSSQLILWDANVEKKVTVDIGLRDILTFIVWAKTGPILAIGTAKGNVSIYNHNTSRYVMILYHVLRNFIIAKYLLGEFLLLESILRKLHVVRGM